jgi:hypothetical protein
MMATKAVHTKQTISTAPAIISLETMGYIAIQLRVSIGCYQQRPFDADLAPKGVDVFVFSGGDALRFPSEKKGDKTGPHEKPPMGD